MYEAEVLKTGINEELLAKVMLIKHLDRVRGIVRAVRVAPAIAYTINANIKCTQ